LGVSLADITGNPYIGVFCRLVGDALLTPPDASDEFATTASEILGVKVVRTLIGGTNLHGSLLASNGKGIIAPYFFDREEIARTIDPTGETGGIAIEMSDDPHTAWGNNLLLGPKAALANPDLQGTSIEKAAEVLGVEVVPMSIAGVKTVGSVAVMNSKGLLVHPKTTRSEMDSLKDVFGVEPTICTANFGSPYLGSSMVVNDRGALIGRRSSGVEMNRMENALDLIS